MVVYGQGNQSRAAYPLILSERQTLQISWPMGDERKEGDADERYMLGTNPVVNIHCCSCQSCVIRFLRERNSRQPLRIVDG